MAAVLSFISPTLFAISFGSLSFSAHAEDVAFRVKARIERNGLVVADTTMVVAESADADVQVRGDDSQPSVRLVAGVDPDKDRDGEAIVRIKYFERANNAWVLVEEPIFKAKRDEGLVAFNTVLVEPHDHYEIAVTVEPI
jgi:hypothetical protein